MSQRRESKLQRGQLLKRINEIDADFHLTDRVDIIIEVKVPRPRENSVRDDVVIRT